MKPFAEEVFGYPALENWLLKRMERFGYPCERGPSGAYAARIREIYIIGLNAAIEGRRFAFPNGEQLRWLAQYLERNEAPWHIILCHAPLLAHNPQRIRGRQPPDLDRDRELQSIVNVHSGVIFLSGHTHFSYNCPIGCVDAEPEVGRIYVNTASVCPTMLKSDESLVSPVWVDAAVTELLISER